METAILSITSTAPPDEGHGGPLSTANDTHLSPNDDLKIRPCTGDNVSCALSLLTTYVKYTLN